MEDKELKEKIAEIIAKNTRYECSDCGADFQYTILSPDMVAKAISSLIRSAGYVQLAEDQTPPDADDEKYYNGMGFNINLYHSDWLTPHKEGEQMVAFKKIIMEREKDDKRRT